jgi:23S rRNA (cytidine1920-2'-O)/16S rRNA (cytidine1409-2'-O)-methyltransferase
VARERLDKLVVSRGLVASREKAQRVIRAGEIRVDGAPSTKPGVQVDAGAEVTIKKKPRFVSRGGEKLEGAFLAFGLNVHGLSCLDVGSSTGGFTDCMLQHGASRVYCVDVGKGQLDWKLRNDDRVVVLEGVNARYLKEGDLEQPPSFAAADVAFISLTKVLPAVTTVLLPGAEIVLLIKPQFEAQRKEVAKGGVVKDPVVRQRIVREIRDFATGSLGIEFLGYEESPLRGPAGNIEYLAHCRLPSAS